MQQARKLASVWILARASLIGVAVAGSVVGCHKTAAEKPGAVVGPSGDSVKQSLAGLKGQLAELETKFSALRKQVEAVPPELPGFSETRAKFYAVEEGRGVMNTKLMLLSNRLDAASASGKGEELQQISKEIAETNGDLRQVDQLHVTLLHQVMALQRMAVREKEAPTAPSPAAPIAKTKRAKSTHSSAKD